MLQEANSKRIIWVIVHKCKVNSPENEEESKKTVVKPNNIKVLRLFLCTKKHK